MSKKVLVISSSLRSIVTITALISKGITDSSLKYHLSTARTNGVTRSEMAEILTHIAFYAGWPNAWAAFRMAKEVYATTTPLNRTAASSASASRTTRMRSISPAAASSSR